jgi:hypothetical protein
MIERLTSIKELYKEPNGINVSFYVPMVWEQEAYPHCWHRTSETKYAHFAGFGLPGGDPRSLSDPVSIQKLHGSESGWFINGMVEALDDADVEAYAEAGQSVTGRRVRRIQDCKLGRNRCEGSH